MTKKRTKNVTAVFMALALLVSNFFIFGDPFVIKASAEKTAIRTYVCSLSDDMDGWWATTYNLKDIMKNAILGKRTLREDATLSFYNDGTFKFVQPTSVSGGFVEFPGFTVTGSYFNSDGKEAYENTLLYYGESYSPTNLEFGRQQLASSQDVTYSLMIEAESANVYAAREVQEFEVDPTNVREMFRWDMERGYLYVVFKGKVTIGGSTNTESQPNLSNEPIIVHMCYDVHDVTANSLGLGWLYDMMDPRNILTPKIHEEIDTNAKDEPGETEVTVSAKVVEGVKDVAKAGAATGAAGAAAAAAAAASGGVGDDERRRSNSTYKMKIYKEFGSRITGNETPYVYARMVEITEDGRMLERPDLTSRISITSADDGLNCMQTGMVDLWQTAQISIDPNHGELKEGIIDFKFKSEEGNTFTNHMHFEICEPSVMFHQENIALPARYEDAVPVQFDIEGFDPENCTVEATMSSGSSYAVKAIQSENVPTAFFAVLVDINTEIGESGTYSTQYLKVKVYDDKNSVEGELPVFRVYTGLNIGVSALNCYRILKDEAKGKAVDELVTEDFYISYTKAKAMVLMMDEEKHEMFNIPVVPTVHIVPLDNSNTEAIQTRLDGIGIEFKVLKIEKGFSDCVFMCKKGWLEPPARFKVKLVADATIGEESYHCEKEVLLRSQPVRVVGTPADQDRFMCIDEQIREILDDTKTWIEDGDLLDYLPGEYLMIKKMFAGYDPNYGYDPILYAQIQSNIQYFNNSVKRSQLKARQSYYEDMQATAYSNAGFWSCVSRSFAKVNEDHLDGWGGLAIRMGAGFFTGGLSEAVFLATDINKAISNYEDSTLLSQRDTWGYVKAGAVPVALTVGGMALFAGGTKVVAHLAPDLIPGLKGLVMEGAGAVYKKIPQQVRTCTENIAKYMKTVAERVNAYDPRNTMMPIKAAEDIARGCRQQAVSKGNRLIRKVNGMSLTPEQQALQNIEMAGNKNAAKTIKKLKEVGDRFKLNPKDPKVLKDLKEVTLEIMEDDFAIKQLNNLGKTEAQIVSNAEVPNYYRQLYNTAKTKFVEEPAEALIKEAGANLKGTTTDKISVFKATGNSAEARAAGIKSPADLDSSMMFEQNNTWHYFTQEQTDAIIYTKYCDAMGIRYTNSQEAMLLAQQKKILAVAPGHREFYLEFDRLGTGEAFSETALSHNMNVASGKVMHDYTFGRENLKRLLSNPAKREMISQNSRLFADGRISYSELLPETKQAIKYVENCKTGIYQNPKIKGQMDAKNIQGMANGYTNQFTEADELTAYLCDQMSKEGTHHLDLAHFELCMEQMGTNFNSANKTMISKYAGVNSACKEATVPFRPSPTAGAYSGAGGSASQLGQNDRRQ